MTAKNEKISTKCHGKRRAVKAQPFEMESFEEKIKWNEKTDFISYYEFCRTLEDTLLKCRICSHFLFCRRLDEMSFVSDECGFFVVVFDACDFDVFTFAFFLCQQMCVGSARMHSTSGYFPGNISLFYSIHLLFLLRLLQISSLTSILECSWQYRDQ